TARPLPPVSVEIAKRAWSAKPHAKETTRTFEQRLRKEIRELALKPVNKLEDPEKWKLLAYLHDIPWKKLPQSWQTWYLETMPNPRLTAEQTSASLERVAQKRFWEITPKELDVYLGWAKQNVPELRQRVVHYARKRVGQPYEMYLLGEFPFEIYDPQPLFELSKSDCVVFCEHTYAMALSSNWKEFFATLQKIRYKNGEIGMLTRNHYTEADWNKNNSWLVKDVTRELGGSKVAHFTEKIDREKFFSRFGIGQGIPVQILQDDYIPAEAIPEIVGKLRDGDFVNVVRGIGADVWVGHTGLIAHNEKGEVTLIHSTPPKVVEVPLLRYVEENVKKNAERAKKNHAQFLGMKFLRLRAEELQR
ncbi:MAG: N-acetylmuramoyl-L-alanine amidase-like domain-containing protein, partial [Candidatus Sumerlaeaceae bacterium]